MSSVTIITSIIVLLAALVCYAFISQTIKTKREQRYRLLQALKVRNRNFKFMLNGFPTGFLPKELTLLVQRSLIDVCEQLSRLEPNDKGHVEDLQTASAQMAETQRQTTVLQRAPLESHQQIKEVKMCLEELYRFIFVLERKSSIPKKSADVYRNMIKQLVVDVTVSSYELNGRAAQQAGKLKLAAHYYSTGLNLLLRQGKSGIHDQKIQQLKALLDQINKEISLTESADGIPPEEAAERAALEGQWDKFSQGEESLWKKKQVYD
ncbi:hypothetical protein [Teredinibacter sp. KSP-S5-2]|uniref:hypothetical protein n=1 Tax=Teredinibacter sp. KSP-S5-2 TaxID=3034506 RepID=UPI00293525E9|nr:hypothetical protein [Teredinibacter sp. KSP-S5-2]WNO09930.1 hypothetical protein P5V12_01960 [Teredinibacter sp. KSP-S5-2]